ncbi:phage baseplate assembly protein V [Burkholderia cepacia]|uniref:phage baseplate assembly protein V n=1 Tax=Burkholderia cepacia TaxID=292 RepID=UPI0029903C9C|nr:phage baseplate assembly protein V [Burkholderia cepacia]
MSIDALLNTIRAHSQMAQGEKTGNRVGEITAYDPNKYAVKVKMWPDTQESLGWIPLASPWIGNGWGLVGGPSIGDQVKIAFDREDQDAGVVVGRMFNDVDQPPAVPSGEFWIVHKSGSLVKFHNDGTVEITAASTMKYTAAQHHFVGPVLMDNTLTGNGGIAISGNNGTGNASSITGNTNFTGTVMANGKHIDDTHYHSDPQGGNTGTVVS